MIQCRSPGHALPDGPTITLWMEKDSNDTGSATGRTAIPRTMINQVGGTLID
jgi:hypothetical protein